MWAGSKILEVEAVREFFEGAAGAFCGGPAEFFAEPDKERVELIEKLNILREIRLE